MPRIQSFRDLDVWQKGMDLVVGVYEVTSKYPRHEFYALTNQTRRAAVSVPSNIAEGHGRVYRGEYAHHSAIAGGSVSELETCLEIGKRLRYASPSDLRQSFQYAEDVSRMLTNLLKSLRAGPRASW